MSETRPLAIESPGHAAFALTMIGFGIAGIVRGGFSAIWGGVPRDLPGREALAYLCAVVSLACGAGVLVRRTAAVASRVLLITFLAWLLVLRLPQMVVSFNVNTWFASAETSVLLAAAWVLYVWLAGAQDATRVGFATGDNGLRIARAFLGVALIPFGIAHFMYVERTASLVPSWLPWHAFWAYFFGCAFIAAGVGVLLGVYARLAAALMVLQIGLFTTLVWVPIIAAGSTKAMDWQEFVVSIALTAAGWVVADSYRGRPWLAVGR